MIATGLHSGDCEPVASVEASANVHRPRRRKFEVAYKVRILKEAEAGGSQVRDLLLREGLSYAHLCVWRKQRAVGEQDGLTPCKRGRKREASADELAQLRRENQCLTVRLARAEAVIEVQRRLCQASSGAETAQGRKERFIDAVGELSKVAGTTAACAAIGVPRATFYRRRRVPTDVPLPADVAGVTAQSGQDVPTEPIAAAELALGEQPQAGGETLGVAQDADGPARPRCPHPRALRPEERQTVLDILHSDRFVNRSPLEITATLLDEGSYYCSARTMYRVLEQNQELKERRDQLKHPEYKKPELLATGPKQVWSWDITKLYGPEKWTYYYLYVVMDIYSRYVVGWMVASRECASLATRLVRETCLKQGIDEAQLTIHSDRGAPMKSKLLVQLYADLGILKSFSRPHVSNDNPFSESAFKTLKYSAGFPDRFGSLEDAREFCSQFFAWYNDEHRHSGICLLTPAQLHFGEAEAVLAKRHAVLEAAFVAHPERFVRGKPQVPVVPHAVWINPPQLVPTPLPAPIDATKAQYTDSPPAPGAPALGKSSNPCLEAST